MGTVKYTKSGKEYLIVIGEEKNEVLMGANSLGVEKEFIERSSNSIISYDFEAKKVFLSDKSSKYGTSKLVKSNSKFNP